MSDNIPDEKECFNILERFDTFPNIIEHSIEVKKVALAIFDNLKNSSHMNRELIIAGALLHDIAKTKSIKEKKPRHDLMGAEIILPMGYPGVAEIIKSHVILENFNIDNLLTEKEIVHYADKRVLHDKVVTIDDRIQDIIVRYGKYIPDKSFIRKQKIFINLLEEKIKKYLIKPLKEVIIL